MSTFEMSTFEMRKVESNGKEFMRPYNTKTQKQYKSKSQASTVIYREVQADESINSKHRRAEFLNRVSVELALGKHGGSTYYHNEQRLERGDPKFGFNSAANKKAALRKKAEKSTKRSEPEIEECPLERWQVILKDTRSVLDSFTSRTAAQKFNKEQKAAGIKSVMWDSNKKAA